MEQHPQLLVYKASAGSGKTFTLAVHYIRQLIEDPYAYRRILAVTFTNKATAEMKERILEQLYGIATADEGSEGYLKEIQKTSAKSVEEIRESAREALRHIIHDYSRFRIETIDSFFQSVMRNLARELELGANLSIELNNTEVLSDAVDAMIEKLDLALTGALLAAGVHRGTYRERPPLGCVEGHQGIRTEYFRRELHRKGRRTAPETGRPELYSFLPG